MTLDINDQHQLEDTSASLLRWGYQRFLALGEYEQFFYTQASAPPVAAAAAVATASQRISEQNVSFFGILDVEESKMGIYKSKKASKKDKQEVQKAGKRQGGDQVKNRQSKPANSVKKKTLWVLSNIFQCGKTQIEDASVDSGVPLATIAANLQHPGTYRADYGPGEDIMFTTHDGKRCYGDFSENNYTARPRTHTVKTMSGK